MPEKTWDEYLRLLQEVAERIRMTCTRIVLLGAELKELDVHSNFQRTNELRTDLLTQGLSFVGVMNVHSGRKSQLFMVEGIEDLEAIRVIARKYGQKALLVVDPEKNTEVASVQTTREAKPLGKLVQVSKDLAKKRKFYLTFKEDGRDYFYITTKE